MLTLHAHTKVPLSSERLPTPFQQPRCADIFGIIQIFRPKPKAQIFRLDFISHGCISGLQLYSTYKGRSAGHQPIILCCVF